MKDDIQIVLTNVEGHLGTIKSILMVMGGLPCRPLHPIRLSIHPVPVLFGERSNTHHRVDN